MEAEQTSKVLLFNKKRVSKKQNDNSKNEKKLAKSIVQVVLGTIIYSFGVVWILQLGGFFSGGVTGISQLIVGLIEKFGGSTTIRNYLGVFVGLVNVPLLLIGWRGVSKHFVFLTILSIGLQTVLMSLIQSTTVSPFVFLLSNGEGVGAGLVDVITEHQISFAHSEANLLFEATFKETMQAGTRLLLAIIGGLVTGFGAALCLKGGGSTGGMDIVSNYLVMKKGIPFTKYQFLVDISIICSSSLISVENVLYTVVRLIVYMKVLQAIYKTYETTRIEIITTRCEELKKALFANFVHGMTIYDAVGGYSNTGKKVIEIYASNFETPEYLALIKEVDPDSFVITTKVKMIRGKYNQQTVI